MLGPHTPARWAGRRELVGVGWRSGDGANMFGEGNEPDELRYAVIRRDSDGMLGLMVDAVADEPGIRITFIAPNSCGVCACPIL